MNLVHSLTAVGAVLSLGAGGIALCHASRGRGGATRTVVAQAGRDQAVIRLLQGARKRVYLRTEVLSLVPVGNELAQALQRGASVIVELPLDACAGAVGYQLPRVLIGLGAVVTFKGDAAENYRGTLLVVDERRFLYSATPLVLCVPGAMVSFVQGSVEK